MIYMYTFVCEEPMSKSTKRLSKNQILLRTAIALIVIVLALFAIDRLAPYFEEQSEEPLEQVDENTTRLARFNYDGKNYIENANITTLLLLGVDKDLDANATLVGDYRNGGQSDFIMLIAIDNANKTVKRLQIDRDTVTQVPYLDVMGKDRGTREWYITLAHSFGKTPLDNNRNTVEAVKNLFQGAYETLYTEDNRNAQALKKLIANPIRVDMCASLYMDGISVFNDAIGGVTVVIEDDLENTGLSYAIGETVTLRGDEAENYVRMRQNVGEGTNEERMKKRQRAYMASALEQIIQKSREDAAFLNNLFDALLNGNYLVSDFSVARLVNELSPALDYEISPIEYIDGTHSRNIMAGKEYNQFNPDANWLTQWILNTYYIVK